MFAFRVFAKYLPIFEYQIDGVPEAKLSKEPATIEA
jgi:hypothetical protein